MECKAYFQGVEAIMDEYGGRPHWGKRHYQSAATLQPRYPEWKRFPEVPRAPRPGARFGKTTTREGSRVESSDAPCFQRRAVPGAQRPACNIPGSHAVRTGESG